MATGFRPKLGMGLQSIVAGDRWDQPIPSGNPPDMGQVPMFPGMTPGTGDMQAKKPGFFGEGGLGRILAGAVGDTLLQNAGMQPVFAPMQQFKQQQAAEQAQWGLRRQQDLADYERKQTPYRFQDNAGNLVELGPDGTPKTIFKDPTPKINYQRVNNPDGTFTMVPIPLGGIPATPPAKPVGTLTPIDGGGVGNGTGNFRQ